MLNIYEYELHLFAMGHALFLYELYFTYFYKNLKSILILYNVLYNVLYI